MREKIQIEKQYNKILEDNGGRVAERARRILLEDSAIKELRPPLEFMSETWRDPFTPSLMGLSCEAVGGSSVATYEAALAMSLMNLSVYIWDDIIDKASIKLFRPTLFGKFGEGTALIIGGLASAKAFSILNQTKIDRKKLQTITDLFWNLWAKVAIAETKNMKMRSQKKLSSKSKLRKITMEAADIETCLKIGALIGEGTENEIRHLGRYGQLLGIAVELRKDFHVSTNLTLELAEKIRSGAIPYFLLWASERSEKIRKKIVSLSSSDNVKQADIKEIVEEALENKMLDKAIKIINSFTKKARESLSELDGNNAIQTLRFLAEAQPSLFVDSLPSLRADGNL
jgi:geranylgeranyl pyrophosphate synthase